jgi:hypothetical protein
VPSHRLHRSGEVLDEVLILLRRMTLQCAQAILGWWLRHHWCAGTLPPAGCRAHIIEGSSVAGRTQADVKGDDHE